LLGKSIKYIWNWSRYFTIWNRKTFSKYNKLIQGISSYISGTSSNNKPMKINAFILKITFHDSNINDSKKKPLFKKLKNELMNIPVKSDFLIKIFNT